VTAAEYLAQVEARAERTKEPDSRGPIYIAELAISQMDVPRLVRMLRVAMGKLDSLSDDTEIARSGLRQIDAIANE